MVVMIVSKKSSDVKVQKATAKKSAPKKAKDAPVKKTMEDKQEGKSYLIPELNIGLVGHVDHGKTSRIR